MPRLALFLLTVFTALAATDPWAKVRDLKSGSELRVYKKAAKQPISAIFDEATEENLIVVIKNEQTAIPKADIERIDFRPKAASRVTRESRTTTKDVDNAAPRVPGSSPGPSTSTTSGVSFGGKGDFQTIYRK